MAEIKKYGFVRHLRSEASFHITQYRKGKVRRSGRGLTFWFMPDGASIAQVPMDDRDMPFLFKGRSRDFQELGVQGIVSWRVADPNLLANRVDFTIDLKTGLFLREPLDQITTLLVGLARQNTVQYLAGMTMAELLNAGLDPLRQMIEGALLATGHLKDMGIQIVAVRLADMRPSAELDKALQAPTFEALQQKADQALFERRALAVEKERAIAENELQNRIELARREKLLIEQERDNARDKASGQAEADQILADGEAARIRSIEQAKADMEKEHIDTFRDLPADVLLGLAARDFAGKLKTIEHFNVTPDMLVGLLSKLSQTPPLPPQIPARK